MNEVKSWNCLRIRELFSSSIPGDWGEESTPELGIPVLRSTNFYTDGSINFTDLAFRKINSERLLKRLVKKNAILIEKSGGSPTQPAGRVVFCNRDFNGTASNFIEIIKIKKEFSPKYVSFLLYYLYQTGLVLKYQQQTTGIINFKLGEYSEELVFLPKNKPEQSKIAEVLSKVDQAIEQTERLIAKQQRIKTGLMQDLLTRGIDEHGNLRSEETHEFKDSPLGRIPVEWDCSYLGDLLILIRNGYTGKQVDHYTDFPLSRIETISNGIIDLMSVGYAEHVPEDYLLRSGDILLSNINSLKHIGKVALVNQTVRLFHGMNLLVLRTSESVNASFLYYQLLRSKSWFEKMASQAVNQASINQTTAKDLLIAMPTDHAEQEAIIYILNEQQTLIDRTQTYSGKLRSLKTALMQDLLTGKVRVTPLLKNTEAID